jgi:threonine dehydratase
VREVVDQIVVVDEPLLRRALAGIVTHEHMLVEGAAAAGVAGILAGQVNVVGKIAVILTGANIDRDRLLEALRPD